MYPCHPLENPRWSSWLSYLVFGLAHSSLLQTLGNEPKNGKWSTLSRLLSLPLANKIKTLWGPCTQMWVSSILSSCLTSCIQYLPQINLKKKSYGTKLSKPSLSPNIKNRTVTFKVTVSTFEYQLYLNPSYGIVG